MEEGNSIVNLMMIGDSNVGKSNLCTRFTQDVFSESINPTIAADLYSKEMNIDGKKIQLKIWDTAGQEKFRALGTSFFRQVQGIILVYDVLDKQTYENLANWLAFIRQNTSQDFVGLLIGNKIDMLDREVPTDKGKVFAEAQNLFFIETSAKESINVAQAFDIIVRKVVEKLIVQEENTHRETLKGIQLKPII